MTDYISIETADGVATIRFNRPEKRNAISQEMWLDLQRLVKQADEDPKAALIVITGAGGHFISGADLEEYETVHATRESTASYLDMTSDVFKTLSDVKKPTVAKIEGACMGGGCLIALACDLRFAADTSRYCLPPAKIGLIFPVRDTKRIIDVVGPAVARDLLFSARVLPAPEALQIGLVNPAAELDQQVDERIRGILANSQWSVRKAKEIIKRILEGQLEDTDETRGWLREALGSADFKEGQKAFMERRAPKYSLG